MKAELLTEPDPLVDGMSHLGGLEDAHPIAFVARFKQRMRGDGGANAAPACTCHCGQEVDARGACAQDHLARGHWLVAKPADIASHGLLGLE